MNNDTAMKLFLITADIEGYDVYEGAVVAAINEQAAKRIHPDGQTRWREKSGWSSDQYGAWPDDLEDIKAKYIGESMRAKPGVILASFHAG